MCWSIRNPSRGLRVCGSAACFLTGAVASGGLRGISCHKCACRTSAGSRPGAAPRPSCRAPGSAPKSERDTQSGDVFRTIKYKRAKIRGACDRFILVQRADLKEAETELAVREVYVSNVHSLIQRSDVFVIK